MSSSFPAEDLWRMLSARLFFFFNSSCFIQWLRLLQSLRLGALVPSGLESWDRQSTGIQSTNYPPWNFHFAPENMPSQKQKLVFQPPFWRGYVSCWYRPLAPVYFTGKQDHGAYMRGVGWGWEPSLQNGQSLQNPLYKTRLFQWVWRGNLVQWGDKTIGLSFQTGVSLQMAKVNAAHCQKTSWRVWRVSPCRRIAWFEL